MENYYPVEIIFISEFSLNQSSGQLDALNMPHE